MLLFAISISLTLKNPSGPVLAVYTKQCMMELYCPGCAFIILVLRTSTGWVAAVATIPYRNGVCVCGVCVCVGGGGGGGGRTKRLF